MFWYPKKRSPGSLTDDPENKPQRSKAIWLYALVLLAIPLLIALFMLISSRVGNLSEKLGPDPPRIETVK